MDARHSRYWQFQPGLTYVNHGSFGACPTPVLEVQAELRARMEADAVLFLDAQLPALLDAVRQRLGAFLNADPQDLVFVPNATSGVNAVVRSLERTLQPGDQLLTTDHEYNATINALQYVAAGRGASVAVAAVPFPVAREDDVLDAVMDRVTPRTRLAMLSWVTSATGVIFPVQRLAHALAEKGVDLLVDAAHAPGMLPIDLHALERAGVTYLTGNAHKWLCAPKGSAFLWVRRDRQAGIHPLVISHGTNAPLSARGRSRFQLEFDWPGTPDPTAFLSLPAALDFVAGLEPGGWPAVMAANHDLMLHAREIVAAALGGQARQAMAPDEMLGAMATLPVPDTIEPRGTAASLEADPDVTLADDPLHADLLSADQIQVPVYAWPARPAFGPARRFLRISAQRYNELDDYRKLAAALARRLTT